MSKKTVSAFLFFLIGSLIAVTSLPAQEIRVTADKQQLAVYDKLEVEVLGVQVGKNPYDYDATRVEGVFVREGGREITVDGFFGRSFNYAAGANEFTETGAAGFKIRFTPRQPGAWRFQVKVYENNSLTYSSPWTSFTCTPESGKKGFIRISTKESLFMEFEDGAPFFPCGLNMAWPDKGGLDDYWRWLGKFKENGGNYIRVWTAPWSFELEWTDTGLKNYDLRQKQAAMLDELVSYAEREGIYIQLCLVPHVEFSTKNSPQWSKCPYNSANGGPLGRPQDFFTSIEARDIFKNKLRYIIARWGYSPSIFVWEVFNEVDLTDGYNAENITIWHDDIFRYIRRTDPYNHLKTTSFSDPYKEELVWRLDDLDFTQTHVYNLRDEAANIYEISKFKLDNYSKPHLVAEYGIDETIGFLQNGKDKDGVNIHNVLWAGSLTLSFGTPMTWWWDDYVEPNHLYWHYKALSAFVNTIDWPSGNFYDLKNSDALFERADSRLAGTVYIHPYDAWVRARTDKFIVTVDGDVLNREFFIAYLYGSAEYQMKNDPIIFLNNKQPARLRIRVARVSDDNTLDVEVNGNVRASVPLNAREAPAATFNRQYGIYQAEIDREIALDLPPGNNQVKLSNAGKGWIRLDKIAIDNYTDPRLAPVFVCGIQNNTSAYLWLKNRGYSWLSPVADPVNDFYLNVMNLQNGNYSVKYIDPYTGETLKEIEAAASGGEIKLTFSGLAKDIAVSVRKI